MSVFSITYSVDRKLLDDHSVICPKCGYAMNVYNLFTKRGKFQGTVGYCQHNCKHDDGQQYFIFSYDLESVTRKAEAIKSEIVQPNSEIKK